MRIWQACFIVVTIGWVVACSSDSDSGLTGPTVLDVGGVWVGNATLASASGAGCAGTSLGVLVGLTYPFTIELDQSASLLSGVQISGLPIDGGDGASCDLTGSVSDTGFALTTSNCDAEPIEDVSCLNDSRRDLTLVSVSVAATVDGDLATGDTTSSWETSDSVSGMSTGTLTVRADFSLRR